MLIYRWLLALGEYLKLMGRTLTVPDRLRMFGRKYYKEITQLGINSVEKIRSHCKKIFSNFPNVSIKKKGQNFCI